MDLPRPSGETLLGGSPEVLRALADLEDLKRAMDQAIILAITDADGRIREVNRAFCEISGYAPEELLGQDHRILNSGLHPKGFFRDLWSTICSGRVWRGEIRNRAKDGHFYWVDTVIVPHLGPDARPERFLALRMDITARKQAEGVLEGSGRLLRDLVRDPRTHAGAPLLDQLAHQIVQALNRRWVLFLEVQGLQGRVLAGRDRDQILAPFSFLLAGTPFAAAAREEGGFLGQGLAEAFAEGLPAPLLGADAFQGLPIRDNEGRIVGLLVVLDDHPMERHHAADAALEVFAAWAGAEMEWQRTTDVLQLSETRLAMALEEMRAGLWEWSIATDDLRFSPGVCEMLSRPLEACPARMAQWRALLHPEDRPEFDLQMEALLEGRVPLLQARLRLAHPEGPWLHAALRGKVARWDDQGRPLRLEGLLIDITESWKRDEAMRETQKLESLGLLAGAISHDFNNLLMAMTGHTEVAMERLRAGEDPIESLARLGTVVEKSRELVKQLLDYSGRGNRVFEALDLSEVTREMTGLMAISVPKRIQLRVEAALDLPPIEGDRSKLQQVVLNLVTNAADAIGEAEGHIRVQTLVEEVDPEGHPDLLLGRSLSPGAFVVLEVADSGCGMDEATLQRIFDPFFTTKRKGRGLGLSVMQGIVRSHGGALVVRSAPGAGSTFRILLPVLR